ncbi:endolytic transglycosylase MltG [Streptococcus mitis]|uniref:Endolytic murein transglycosylase n=1 Tax=Streptococcus mitis TaxID=28037 RepID=A0A1X1L466_STRMT|nr:endolytic transglycosylase MltG [Streptococcus mitis]MCY7159869.1 endolytic transglycosylase MltG [Streptococcus mitis]ORP06505.1 aminodeoxychorismate lyase [Streptococcus mitis]
MSEKSREDEKLSFKEQILRDLESVKKQDRSEQENEITSFETPSSQEDSVVPLTQEHEPSAEELMVDSLSVVDQILKNAPSVPSRSNDISDEIAVNEEVVESKVEAAAEPVVEPVGPIFEPVQPKVEPVKLNEDKEFNDIPTKVSVSYKTNKQQEEVSIPEVGNELSESDELVDSLATVPRRSRRETAKPVKKKKSHLKAFFISLLIFLALISAGGYFGYQYVQSSLLPVDANSKEYVTVQIPEGSNVQEIGNALEKSGLVKHGIIFSLYAKYKNYSDFKSGYYNLMKSMSTDDLIKELQKGGTPEPQEPSLADLTIPEGYTIDQIAQTVGQLQGEFKEPLTAEAFLAKVQDDNFISQEVAKYPNLLESLPTKESGARYRLEGYLFPATYSIKESTTIESLIDEMLAAMDKTLTPHYSAIKSKNLTVNELLTIASLVEKEGAKTEDRKLIAGVFYNRLNLGMPLQSNIAILYAQGKLGQNISLADDAGIDTSINSPYNVYTKPGLMPGPVDSPSQDAIEASINQTKSENLYFVANVTDGKVYYAVTQEEHDRNVAEHVNSKLTQNSSSN